MKLPENGIIGKLPAPSVPVGEFTENPTFQAVRGITSGLPAIREELRPQGLPCADLSGLSH